MIVGRVTGLTPRLVPDSDFVYTEYSISIESIVKNDSAWRGGENAVAVGPAGTASAADGHTIAFHVRGLGQPIETGEHYLLFLRYPEVAECFQFTKAWRIQDGLLRSKARYDSKPVPAGWELEGQPLDAVMARIRAAAH